jgi:hypothetical protein
MFVGPYNPTRARLFFVPNEYLLADDAELVAWLEDTALAERELRAFLDAPSKRLGADEAAAVERLLAWSMDGHVSRTPFQSEPVPRIANPGGGSAVIVWFDAAGRVATDGSAHELILWREGRMHRDPSGSVVAWSMELSPTLNEGAVDVQVRAPRNGYVYGEVPASWDGARLVVHGPEGWTGDKSALRFVQSSADSDEVFWIDDLVPGTYRADVESFGADGVLRVFTSRVTVGGATGHEVVVPASLEPRVEFELGCSGAPTELVDASFAADGAPFEIFFETDRHKYHSPRLQPKSRRFAVEGLAAPTWRVTSETGRVGAVPGASARQLILTGSLDQVVTIADGAWIELPVTLLPAADAALFDLVLASPPGRESATDFQVALQFESGAPHFRHAAVWDANRRRHVVRPHIDLLANGTYTLVADAIDEADALVPLGAVVVENGRIVSDRFIAMDEGHWLHLRFVGTAAVPSELHLEFTTPEGRLDVAWHMPVNESSRQCTLPPLPYGTAVRIVGTPAHPTSFVVERGVRSRTIELFE